jgi:hypothetical protein
MNLLKYPQAFLLHFFFLVSIILHILSLYQQDFDHESPLSHIIQLVSYIAGWWLCFVNIKNRKYFFPIAVAFPWIEHIRLLFQYFLDPATLAFWICLLVALLMPYLAVLIFMEDRKTQGS